MGQAVEHFSGINAAEPSPFANFLNDTMLISMEGQARYELALFQRDRRAADRAVPLLRQAAAGFGADYARPRAYDGLRILNAALEPLHTSAGVAELRERLTTAA